jgi:hypothetical protein
MKKIIDYTVFTNPNLGEFEDMVKGYIKEGWYPLGGITFVSMGSREYGISYFCQAMVRYEEGKV